MAFANIFLRTARDRWLGWAIAAASLTLLLLFGMFTYREIDLTVYSELPEAFRSLLGISDDVDVGGLAVGYVFGSFGRRCRCSNGPRDGRGVHCRRGEERHNRAFSSSIPRAVHTSCCPRLQPSCYSRP